MFLVKVHNTISKIITLYHLLGIWKHVEKTVFHEWGRKIFLFIFSVSAVVSLISGAIESHHFDESIFLSAAAIGITVILVKLFYILWKKDEIFYFLQSIATHRIANRQEFTKISRKLKIFTNFISFFCFAIYANTVACLILSLPIFSNKRSLPINIGFPFDWKNNEIGFWMAFSYLNIVVVINTSYLLITTIIWYIMLNCSIKYQLLQSQFKNLGKIKTTVTSEISLAEKQNLFLEELIELIKTHHSIQETIERFKSCFDILFFAQISTSGICICGAIYVLAFNSRDNLMLTMIYVVFVIYNFFDIFMIMYLGNEIKWYSGRLSYALFQSDWIDQSKSCKKSILILMEVLKKPQELVTGLVYPLNLEAFTSILKCTYSSFNILLNFK